MDNHIANLHANIFVAITIATYSIYNIVSDIWQKAKANIPRDIHAELSLATIQAIIDENNYLYDKIRQIESKIEINTAKPLNISNSI